MKRKVLVYNNSFFLLSETFICEQVELLQREYDITLLGNEIDNEIHFPIGKMDVRLINRRDPFVYRMINRIRRRVKLYTPFEFVEKKEIRRWLRYYRPDVVHAHFGYNAVKIMPLLKEQKIPLIVSFHGVDASMRIHHQAVYLKRLPSLLNYASGIIIVSRHMRNILPLDTTNRRKVFLLPYAVDIEFFTASAPRKKAVGDMINILHSGRLTAKKGICDLIRVFTNLSKKHSNILLHILGDGDECALARNLVDALGIAEKVIFYGAQPKEKVKELMDSTDIFVLNSRTAENGDMEGTPVSLLEAMSMGMAVVSTRHAGIPDVIRHNFNGMLVCERNNEELYDVLERLITNPDTWRTLGNQARKTIEERFNRRILASKLSEVYSLVLSRPTNQE